MYIQKMSVVSRNSEFFSILLTLTPKNSAGKGLRKGLRVAFGLRFAIRTKEKQLLLWYAGGLPMKGFILIVWNREQPEQKE